jgi:hypothetical protein
MAPGAFSILAPFLRRKVKKYERLETEDPEKKRQEATLEELTRINMKIVSALSFEFVTIRQCANFLMFLIIHLALKNSSRALVTKQK